MSPWSPFVFQNHLYSVLLPISCKTFTLNDILKVFPIEMHWRSMLTDGRTPDHGHPVSSLCEPAAKAFISRSTVGDLC